MSFNYKSPFTIDHTKVQQDFTDFVVLVNITDNRFKTVANGGHVQNANGYDIRPYSDSGLTTPLTYELDTFIATTGTVAMWIKIPSLSSSTDLTFYLAYGDGSLSSNGSSSGTWDSNYQGVYHMGTPSSLSLVDSTGHSNGSSSGPTASTGIIGGAISLAGNHATLKSDKILAGQNAWMMSMWLKTTQASGAGEHPYSERNGSNNYIQMPALVSGGSYTDHVVFNIRAEDNNYFDTIPPVTINDGTWHYCVVYFNTTYGNQMKTWVDNNFSAERTYTGNNTFTTGYDTQLGRFDTFTAQIDEVRLSTGNARTGAAGTERDWILTEYNNQGSPSTFMSIGTEVGLPHPLSQGVIIG